MSSQPRPIDQYWRRVPRLSQRSPFAAEAGLHNAATVQPAAPAATNAPANANVHCVRDMTPSSSGDALRYRRARFARFRTLA
jgi:hypothetical protein